MDFTDSNQIVIGLMILLVLLAIYVCRLYKKYKVLGKEAALADLRETAYALFLKAEEKYGAKTGPQKMAYAVRLFYQYAAPDSLEKLLPGTTVEKFLQDTFEYGYDKLKDILNDGQINNSTTR